MYRNLDLAGLGDFGSANYWSSFESGESYAMYEVFGTASDAGSQGYVFKSYGVDFMNIRVRAVRAF